MKDSDKALIFGIVGVVALVIVFVFILLHHGKTKPGLVEINPAQQAPRIEAVPTSQTVDSAPAKEFEKVGDPRLYPGLGIFLHCLRVRPIVQQKVVGLAVLLQASS